MQIEMPNSISLTLINQIVYSQYEMLQIVGNHIRLLNAKNGMTNAKSRVEIAVGQCLSPELQ